MIRGITQFCFLTWKKYEIELFSFQYINKIDQCASVWPDAAVSDKLKIYMFCPYVIRDI